MVGYASCEFALLYAFVGGYFAGISVIIVGLAMAGGFSPAITLDMVDGSFWTIESFHTTGNNHGTFDHYTKTGAHLSSFSTANLGDNLDAFYGLALDPIDGTLWASAGVQGGHLFQYNQAGTLLQDIATPGIA